ncbi:hypothetical protein [Lacinutrix cladophorae]
MKISLTTIVLLISLNLYSQDRDKIKKMYEQSKMEHSEMEEYLEFDGDSGLDLGDDDDEQNITTSVITLDLSNPRPNSVSHSGNKKKLIVKNKNPLAIKLINGNTLRYRYVLKYEKENLFGSGAFSLKPQKNESIEYYDNYIDSSATLADNRSIKDLKIVIEDNIDKLKKDISGYLKSIMYQESVDTGELEFARSIYREELDETSKNLRLYENIVMSSEKPNLNDVEILKFYKLEHQRISDDLDKLYEASTDVYLPPLDIFGDNIDYVKIILEIYEGNETESKKYEYKIWLTGGLKIDVSAGAFITSIFDEEFLTNDGVDGKKSIRRSDAGEYDFGFGPMVNISFRSASWFRPTINFGTLLTSEQKFQIMAGGGLIMGKNDRFILSAGIVMGRVDVLSEGFLADGTTEYDLGTSAEVPTNEKFQFGHFIGVTYNLSSKK